MRLKTKEYKEIMQKKNLTSEQICQSTGLSAYSLDWILENGGFTSENMLQGLALVAGVELKEIVRSEPSDCLENGIEFTLNGKTATVQFSQGRFKTRIKKFAQSHPDECKILVENPDGTLLAHVPVEWIKISPLAVRSELQREAARRNLSEARRAGHEKG